MINLLFIIIILTSASIFSQEENYSVKNDFVVWSKIYEGTPSIDNLALEYLDGSTSGKIKAGSLAYNWLLMEGLFRIEEKEGRYRVTVYQMWCDVGGGSTYTAENYWKTKNRLRTGSASIKRCAKLDKVLDDIFKPAENVATEDW